MLFLKADDLKTGMRLAKPIYNKNGVMLYERNSRLTSQGIVSIHNFGLIGVYILEPAEPVPPRLTFANYLILFFLLRMMYKRGLFLKV